MIISILESAGSAVAPLKYNTDKMREQQVTIVCSGNLPNSLPDTARNVFLERETHPSLSRKAKRLAFHVAVNPDINDPITDKQIPELVQEYMEKMGYGDQPYLVFKHNDIEREHFHIVSSNILPTGRVIRSCFNVYRSQKAGRELGQKYGFVMGKREKAEETVRSVEELMGPKLRFRPEAPVREQFTAIVRRAHEFNYESYAQFVAVLAAFGMHVQAVKRKDGKWRLKAYAADENGKVISRLYAIDKMIRKDIIAEFRSHSIENVARGRNEDIAEAGMGAAAVLCLDWARSYAEYKAMIRRAGFDVYTYRNEEGQLLDVNIVDKRKGRVQSVSELEPSLDIERLKAIFDSPQWKRRPKQAEGNLTRAQMDALHKEVQIRLYRVQEKIEEKTERKGLTI